MDGINHTFESLIANNYLVEDIVTSNHKYIFILESPHKDELIHGFPVSGSAGKGMTRIILDYQLSEALGILIGNQRFYDHQLVLSRIGLMNVCQIPLQASAYSIEHQEQYKEFLEILEGLRINYMQFKHRSEAWNMTRAIITNKLKERLERLTEQSCTIIPCGRFADQYLKDTNISSPAWEVIEDIPHPARNQWSNGSIKDRIENILNTPS
ncbi:hypothetical protein J2S74_003005 [Evansella vedderi]|uniref:Uracil-DNA glycosylase-like domain-containing protein n=1 Tax=Evansella vedderi TaxID=38282 RepID=A0ABT9ZYV7_9BACI|nr:hypothetical protein [Evansella vedderi]MDQ0255623.1 hypothetical protein [Evansella vedderi]